MMVLLLVSPVHYRFEIILNNRYRSVQTFYKCFAGHYPFPPSSTFMKMKSVSKQGELMCKIIYLWHLPRPVSRTCRATEIHFLHLCKLPFSIKHFFLFSFVCVLILRVCPKRKLLRQLLIFFVRDVRSFRYYRTMFVIMTQFCLDLSTCSLIRHKNNYIFQT